MADYITLNSSNTSNNGTNNWRYFADLTFNGVGVTYVPAEFVAKGVVVDGVQLWDQGFTDPDVLKYLKPVEIDKSLLSDSQILKLYSNPTKGYIFDWGSASAESSLDAIYQIKLKSYMTPITGMRKVGDSYQYMGAGDNRYSTYSPTTVHSEWQDGGGGILGSIGNLLGDLGPAVLLLNFVPGLQGVGTALYVGTQIGQGNLENAALALVAANLPDSSGVTGMEGSMFEIPSVANMATSLTEMGLDAAAANAVITGGLKLIATGGDIEKSFTEALGNYVGAKAGDYVKAMKGFDGYKDLQTIAANVTKASTAAFMKNQDVEKAASSAFISSSIPIAFNSVPGFKDFAKENPTAASAIINGAIATANGKDVSLEATIRNTALDFMAEKALSEAPGYSSMSANEKKAYKEMAIAQAQGKPLNNALYNIMTAKVESGVNEAVAKKEGWDSYSQKQEAVSLFGSKITPAKYDANVVTEDEALSFLKDAGITRDPTSDELHNLMKGTESAAKQFVDQISDVDSVTFDGTKFETNEQALLAASKAGYNTFRSSDGNIYTIMSKDQYDNVAAQAKQKGVDNPLSDAKLVNLAGQGMSDVYLSTEVPSVVIVAKRPSAPETYDAWIKDQQELKDLGGTSFPKWMSDQLNLLDIITKENKGTKAGDAANLIEQAIAFGGRNFGSLAKQISQSVAATGWVDYDNVAARTAAAIERWGNSAQNKSLTDAENAIINRVNGVEAKLTDELGRKPTTAELMGAQAAEFYKAGMANKLGMVSLIAGEGLQELPFLAASGGVGKVVGGLMGKAAGYAAAMGTDASLNAAESFAGNYTDVYETLLKKGFSEEAAKAKATTSGIEAALVTFGSELVGDSALVKAFIGDATKLSAGALTKEAAKQYVTEYGEGMLQNASSQYAINGKVDWGKATAAGAIEGAIGSGVSTGFLSADKLNYAGVVGQDEKGNNVTLREYLDGTKNVTSVDSNFNISGDNTNKMTIGDATNYYSEFTKNPDITAPEYFSTVDFFRATGYGDPSPDEIAKFVGSATDVSNEDLQKQIKDYTNPILLDQDELKQIFISEGYSAPSAEEIAKYVVRGDEAASKETARTYADERSVTRDEALKFFTDQGYTPTEDDLAAYIGIKNEIDTGKSIESKYDPLATSEQEVRDMFKSIGYEPSDSEVAKYVGQMEEAKQLDLVKSYGNTALAVKELTGPLNKRIEELIKQGQDYQTATKNALDELVKKNEALSTQIGTEAKTVTQEDIDAINKMISGEVKPDLAYDVNKDNQITQEDIDALNKYIKSDTNPNPETNFDPYTNTHWAPTGLYKTIYDQEIQRQKDLEAAKAREAENFKKTQITQGVLGFNAAANAMLPQLQQLQSQASAQKEPDVVKKSSPLDFSQPLDVGFFGEHPVGEADKEKLAKEQQGIVKIASGGSVDDLLSLLYRG